MLRVTAGEVRGFKLDVPDSEAVRPPLEILRQAVFNILGQDLSGWRVIDLFSGSGIMGIEALSRGAERAVFVERDRRAVAVIRKNLGKTRLEARASVIGADAFRTPAYLAGEKEVDAVFVDPPFEMIRSADPKGRIERLVETLFGSPALAAAAVVVVRVPRDEALDAPANAETTDDRVYGHSRVLFFARKTAQTTEAQQLGPVEEAPEREERGAGEGGIG